MASLNKAMLIGNLGKDPEVRYTQSGTAVAGFSIATGEKFKNKSGEYEERTEWHNVTAWGKLAEICGEYLSKGKTVYIEGRIQARKWQDKDGNDRYSTEIVADKMVMLGGGKGGGQDSGRGGEKASDRGAPGGNSTEYGGGGGGFSPDDDIPF